MSGTNLLLIAKAVGKIKKKTPKAKVANFVVLKWVEKQMTVFWKLLQIGLPKNTEEIMEHPSRSLETESCQIK